MPWSDRGSYLVTKTHTPSFDSPWFCLAYGAFVIVCSSFVPLLWLIRRNSTIRGINSGEAPGKYENTPMGGGGQSCVLACGRIVRCDAVVVASWLSLLCGVREWGGPHVALQRQLQRRRTPAAGQFRSRVVDSSAPESDHDW